jgi:hypothetical protein
MIEPAFAHKSQVMYVHTDESKFEVVTEINAAIIGALVEMLSLPDQLYFFDSSFERRICQG